jgi:hypothetical protein
MLEIVSPHPICQCVDYTQVQPLHSHLDPSSIEQGDPAEVAQCWALAGPQLQNHNRPGDLQRQLLPDEALSPHFGQHANGAPVRPHPVVERWSWPSQRLQVQLLGYRTALPDGWGPCCHLEPCRSELEWSVERVLSESHDAHAHAPVDAGPFARRVAFGIEFSTVRASWFSMGQCSLSAFQSPIRRVSCCELVIGAVVGLFFLSFNPRFAGSCAEATKKTPHLTFQG